MRYKLIIADYWRTDTFYYGQIENARCCLNFAKKDGKKVSLFERQESGEYKQIAE